jgi:hypothetical protein
MRDLVGKTVRFILEGQEGAFSGEVLKDAKDRVFVKSETGITRLIKSKVCGFEPAEEPGEWVNLLVLACQNTTIGCPGVQYVQEGDGFKQTDFDVFMGQCPRKCDSCKRGSKGELRSVDGPFLRQMLAGVICGEYPKGESS